MKKRLLSLALMLCMVLSLLPTARAAEKPWAQSTEAFATYMYDTYKIAVVEQVYTPQELRERLDMVFANLGADFVRAVADKWSTDFGRSTFYLYIKPPASGQSSVTASANISAKSVAINLYAPTAAGAGYVNHEFGHILHHLLRKYDSGFDTAFKAFNGERAYGSKWASDDGDYFIGSYGKSSITEDIATLFENMTSGDRFKSTLAKSYTLYQKSVLLRDACSKYILSASVLDYIGDIKPPAPIVTSDAVVLDGTNFPATAAGLTAALKTVKEGGSLDIRKDITLTSMVTIEKSVTLTSSNGSKIIRSAKFSNNHMFTIKATDHTIIIRDLTIDGNHVAGNLNGFFVKDGSLVFQNGAVLENCMGAGVQTATVGNVLAFTMNGGTIRNNSGSGVLANSGIVTMTGGTITENTNANGSAGVYIAYGKLRISGDAIIFGNTTVDGAESNVYLRSNQTGWMSIVSVFTGKVGLSTETYPTAKNHVPIQTGGEYIPTVKDASHIILEKTANSTGTLTYSIVVWGELMAMIATTSTPASITLSDSKLAMNMGEKYTLGVTALPTAASIVYIRSSDTRVVAHSEGGILTAQKVGTATITAYFGTHVATCEVTVAAGQKSPIAFPEATAIVGLNKTVNLAPIVTLEGNVWSTLNYDSSDMTVVSVDKTGQITGKKLGKATITVTLNVPDKLERYSTSIVVSVTTHGITHVRFANDTLTLKARSSLKPDVIISPPAPLVVPIFASSDKKIASVDIAGTIYGVSPGTAVITVTAENVSATCTVTVTASDKPGLTLNAAPTKKDYAIGEGFDPSGFSATYNDGKTIKDLTPADVKFVTSDGVTLTAGRTFTAVGKKKVVVTMGTFKVDFTLDVTKEGKPAEPVAPATAVAAPSPVKLIVDGKSVAVDAYLINQNNYIKLRDLAVMINGTDKNFEVSWDGAKNAINLKANSPYTVQPNDMSKGDGQSKNATINTSTIYIDGVQQPLTAYLINQNNYFKLRDVMEAFDVYVGWDQASGTATLDTSKGYERPAGQ